MKILQLKKKHDDEQKPKDLHQRLKTIYSILLAVFVIIICLLDVVLKDQSTQSNDELVITTDNVSEELTLGSYDTFTLVEVLEPNCLLVKNRKNEYYKIILSDIVFPNLDSTVENQDNIDQEMDIVADPSYQTMNYTESVADYIYSIIDKENTIYYMEDTAMTDVSSDYSVYPILYGYIWTDITFLEEESTDIYSSMLNATLVKTGQVQVCNTSGTSLYYSTLKEYESLAKESKNGFWKYNVFE